MNLTASDHDSVLHNPVLSPEVGPSVKKPSLTKSRSSSRVSVMHTCEQLVNELTMKEESWPFLKPVTKRDVSQPIQKLFKQLQFSLLCTGQLEVIWHAIFIAEVTPCAENHY